MSGGFRIERGTAESVSRGNGRDGRRPVRGRFGPGGATQWALAGLATGWLVAGCAGPGIVTALLVAEESSVRASEERMARPAAVASGAGSAARFGNWMADEPTRLPRPLT